MNTHKTIPTILALTLGLGCSSLLFACSDAAPGAIVVDAVAEAVTEAIVEPTPVEDRR